jgi:hypothetical protein
VPLVGIAGDIYDAANPDLAALLSQLSGSYHSDRAQGTYRFTRIDNKGPRPAMVNNGQVLHNLVLDNGGNAILVGPKTSVRLQLKLDMKLKNAIGFVLPAAAAFLWMRRSSLLTLSGSQQAC